MSEVKNNHEDAILKIGVVTCCGFSVGDKVNTPFGESDIWKVTETSVPVKHWDDKRERWMFSKYLTEPWHHSQLPVSVLSHCSNGCG